MTAQGILAFWNRRALLCSALSAALPLTGARAIQPLKLRLGIVTVSSQMALQIGVVQGMFARHGFDVEIRPLASGAQANQALAAGQVDWSAGGIESTIVAASSGLPFKPYAMYAKGGDSLGILVRTDANIRDAAGLAGKRIAVAAGTGSAQGLSQYLQAHGLPNAAVKRVNANFANMGQMLLQGAVDGMAGLEPFLTVTQDAMGDQAVMLTRLGKYVQGGGFFLISDDWATAHADRIDAAVEALAESQFFIRHNPDQAARLNAAFVKAPADVIKRSSKVFEFGFDIDPFTIASLERTSKFLLGEKLIPGAVDVAALLAPARRVTAALVRRRADLLQ